MSLAADAEFDAAMVRRLPSVAMRPETADDRPFLFQLYSDCSPLTGTLPEAMVSQQAEFANGGFRANHPDAMRRIAFHTGAPIGRFYVDWDYAGRSHGVDIAVLRSARATGLALAMLRSWLEVADGLGRVCTLEVLAGNPAQGIYRRLGFEPVTNADENMPMIDMIRPARGPGQAARR